MGVTARAEHRVHRLDGGRAAYPGDPLDGRSERMRLLLAIGSLATGGSEKQLTQLVLRLPKDRFDPVILMSGSADSTTHFARELRSEGLPIVSIAGPRDSTAAGRLGVLRRYRRAVRLIDPDLVYAWLDETAALLAPICRLRGIPCLVARRNILGSELERRRPLLGIALRRAESLATLVTANSSAVADACVRRGHDPARVRIVSNGHERLGPLPTPPAPPVVFGYVAHFRPEKGHHRLIDAVERIPKGSWRVDLAGVGPLREEIAERIRRADLGDQVKLIGGVDDVRDFWRARHVALLLSDSEGSPNALLEAAVAARPVIATAVGGTPELVGSGGVLVHPDDTGTIAETMQGLIGDPERRSSLGHQIHAHAIAAYSIPRMLESHIEALQETHARAAGAYSSLRLVTRLQARPRSSSHGALT